MSHMFLESENGQNLSLIKELAEQLNIHCRFVLQQPTSKNSQADEISVAIELVKTFSQASTSFGDPLVWQQSERQERFLD